MANSRLRVAMTLRGLMLTQSGRRADVVGLYATELRRLSADDCGLADGADHAHNGIHYVADYLVPRRRSADVWLMVGIVGTAACIWWMSSIDTSRRRITCLDARVLGRVPRPDPSVFLTDEIEGLNPKDFLYAGTLAIVGIVVPILTVPTATATVIKAWSDVRWTLTDLTQHEPSRSDGGGGACRRLLPAAWQSGPTLNRRPQLHGRFRPKLRACLLAFRLGLRF